ncbi:signal transduction histidine kinase [Marinilabilia salmonicolor]|jgi:signal transduction histidine kinase|uniref:ATP-binding protein n=1 Tax=Marinilabilia salmonicolor TaxID=989 RepID=UPI000D05C649|nr:ATP-binding protein [Marinilabilia salmonicolor]PRZ00306.1 signal transduction histidine kinase [Marinilabilia salmonicolor]
MVPKRALKNVILTTLLWLASMGIPSAQNNFKDIVLLNSYHPTFKWTADITRGVLQELPPEENYRVFVEYMDSKRFQSDDYLKGLNKLFSKKYDSINIDGVILSDNNALDFFLKYGNEIWGNVPVSFCGINNIHEYSLDTSKFRGVDEKINIDSTLSIIQVLQPNLEELIVVSDSTHSGQIFSNQFAGATKRHTWLNYRFLHADSPEQLSSELQAICTSNKAIYLLSLYINRDGFPREMLEEAPLIIDNCKVPVYSNWDFLFNNFIVGGVVIRGIHQGREAASIMKETLNGTYCRPWLTHGREILALDYRQTNRNGLNFNSLTPPGILLNKPENPFQRFKQEIIIIISVLGFLVIVIIVLLRVLNQKKKAEKELAYSESRLELALDGANEGLWDVDFINGEVFLSHRFARLLKYNNPNEIGFNTTNYKNFFHPDDHQQVSEAFQMHKGGLATVFRCEARLINNRDQYVWFSVHGKITERDLNREPLRMVGTITEIQSQKEFENQLRDAKEKAEESDRLKSAFLANMSHEIRTPMNAILGFTDLILNDLLDKNERYQYLRVIKNSGENLLNIINDIIDISKIESGQLKIKDEKFDLHMVLQNIKNIAESLLVQKDKKIRFLLSPGSRKEVFTIVTDQYRLHQLLLNLVTNAIKFTTHGTIEAGYTIRDEKTLVFFVKDTGHGIAPKYKNIIFERFRQVDETPVRKFGGTGLGLAITKSLIAMMKGDIWFNSEPGKGSEFYFSLPCEFNQ